MSPHHLAGETLISFAPDTPHGRVIDATYRLAGASRQTAVFVQFVDAAIAFVSAGIGVAIVDEFSATDCEQIGHVGIPLEQSVEIPAYVHWCRVRPRARATDELIGALTEVVNRRR